jgi:Spy/CpxP family protein refolding chaperone
MKLLPILAAAAAAALAIPAATAAVAPAASVAKAEIQHHNGYHKKRVYYRKVCTTKWRHGRRYQSCRNVRYYR